MTGFLSKLKVAFSKEIVFFFCVALPYLITFILLAVYNRHIGLVISNILYWTLFFIHHALRKYNEKKEYEKLYTSEFEE